MAYMNQEKKAKIAAALKKVMPKETTIFSPSLALAIWSGLRGSARLARPSVRSSRSPNHHRATGANSQRRLVLARSYRPNMLHG